MGHGNGEGMGWQKFTIFAAMHGTVLRFLVDKVIACSIGAPLIFYVVDYLHHF
jgi:hypothetical protein